MYRGSASGLLRHIRRADWAVVLPQVRVARTRRKSGEFRQRVSCRRCHRAATRLAALMAFSRMALQCFIIRRLTQFLNLISFAVFASCLLFTATALRVVSIERRRLEAHRQRRLGTHRVRAVHTGSAIR